MSDKKLTEAKEAFRIAVDAESENRNLWKEDMRFGRLGEQWPAPIQKQREIEGRPSLTINRMPSFIRQIVNDARQNKPQIKVKPVDGNADIDTANIYSGLIRNIEQASNADVAYDTAVDFAVSGGFGYIKVDVDYSYDDTFERELRIERVANPLTIYGDPHSTSADSSDWNTAFEVDYMSRDEFGRKYKGADAIDWDGQGYDKLPAPWMQDEEILVAAYWKREEYTKNLLLLANKMAVAEDVYKKNADVLGGIEVIKSRPIKCYKIKHHIMTGVDILETNEWAGKYIPIIPVYGEEINIEGKRYFRSLIRDAKDAQRMTNYWRSIATELVALAPRVPWLIEDMALNIEETEVRKWATANSQSHPYLMHKHGSAPPTRLPLDSGTAAGAMTEALQAADDMKSIMGMFDASLGAKSNETSGKAIMARQREGDVSTFHFIDNLARAIRHTGCVLIDMIPMVYTGERIVRTLGEDGTPANAQLGQLPEGYKPGTPWPEGMERIFDLSVGKYDLAVSTGPGFTTRREESAMQMTEMIRAFPPAAPVVGPYMVKNLDWPDAEAISEDLKLLSPARQNEVLTPELKQQIQEGQQKLQQQDLQIMSLKAGNDVKMAEIELKKMELQVKEQELQVQMFEAETQRYAAMNPAPVVVGPQKAAA